jgi:hypothetical protein
MSDELRPEYDLVYREAKPNRFASGLKRGNDMNPSIPEPDSSAETYQVGTTPVQAFTSPAIPVPPGAVVSPRLGRPSRIRVEPRQEGPEVDGAAPA